MSNADPDAGSVNAFAHSRRVRIFRLLVERPEIGRSLAALQAATGYKVSVLAKHLTFMERAGLVERDPAGHAIAGALMPGGQLSPIAIPVRPKRRAAVPNRRVA